MSSFNESQNAVLAAEGNILVSASAGSGKTTVMIEKIYRLIVQGCDVNRMAVMTFSKASAAEMKNRLVKKLYEAMRRGGEEGARAGAQLGAFPFANICTLDSFCYSLLKKYYTVTGSDPSATPLDPSESEAMWNECLDRACETALENPEFVRFAVKYSSTRSLDGIKKLVDSLKKFLNVQPEPEKFFTEDFGKERVKYLFKEQKKILRRLQREVLEAMMITAADGSMSEWSEALEELSKHLESLSNMTDPVQLWKNARFEGELPDLRKKGGSPDAREKYGATKEYVLKTLDVIAAYYELYTTKVDGSDDVAMLNYVTQIALEYYAKRKQRDGKLDFNDLNRIALEILNDRQTRCEVRDSFDFVFIDEYQDTNYLQERLIERISKENNVFAVGDVKQAIYKFRYAEPEIFNARMESYNATGKGQAISLSENYRSKRAILDFVNDVCGEVMTEDFCGIDYAAHPMSGGTDYRETPEDSAVEIYRYKPAAPAKKSGVYSVRDADVEAGNDLEARFVARKISELVLSEKIYRPKSGTERRVEYGDIAVLTRTGNGCLKIAAALDAARIPYTLYGDGKGGFYPRDLLVDFLRLCICEDDVPVINVMSCPVFGFSPDEMTAIAIRDKNTSFWEAVNNYSGNETIEKKIKYFLDYIEKTRKMSAYAKPTELIAGFLADGLDGYFDSVCDGAGGRIGKFLSSVESLECNSDVSDFISYYDASYKGEKPPAIPDSVTVMTMHKSKGLEFPIVILPYCGDGKTGGDRGMGFYADKDLGIALKVVDEEKGEKKDGFDVAVLRSKKSSDSRQELARLMYVDFTRAENKLIIVGREVGLKSVFDVTSIMEFIAIAAEKHPRIKFRYRDIPTEGESVPAVREEEEGLPDLSYLDETYRHISATSLPNKRSVSEMSEGEDGIEAPFGRYDRSKKGDRELGTAYHLFMQRADLGRVTREEIEEEIRLLTESGEISADIAAKIDAEKLGALLRSEIIESARKNVCYREQPFISAQRADDGYTLVQGVIDLLIEEPDGLTVVDFKASGADRETLVKRYAAQVEIYADAAERIYGKRIKRKILFNILGNYVVEI